MSMPKTVVAVAVVAGLHLAFTSGLCLLCDRAGIGPYSSQGEPTITDAASEVVLRVLISPGHQVYKAGGFSNEELLKLVITGNSLLWSAVLVGIFSLAAQLFGHPKHDTRNTK